MAESGTNHVRSMNRLITKLVLREVVAPMVTYGHLTLDEVEGILYREVATALNDTGETKAVLASHIGRSESWLYQRLREAREEEEREELEADPADRDKGNRFVMDVLLAFSVAHPKSLSLPELRERLQLEQWEISDLDLLKKLQLYVQLGFLQSVGQARGEPKFVAVDPVVVSDTGRSGLQKLAERLSWLAALARSSLEGQGLFGGVSANLHPEALKRARARIQEAVGEIIAEAVAETNRSDEPESSNVFVRALIAIGAVGGSDGYRVSRRRRRNRVVHENS